MKFEYRKKILIYSDETYFFPPPLFELEFISQHQVKNTTIEKRRKREDGTFLSSFEIGMLTLVKVWFHSFSKWRNTAVRKYRMIQCTDLSFLKAY